MLAFCLPNDEKVRASKGSKLVLLKNISLAKHKLIMEPVADICVRSDQRDLVTFDAFFTHTLCHECCHSIGPHDLSLDGKETTVRLAMEELHSALEEAKADIVGLWALRYLTKKGTFSSEALDEPMYVSFLVGAIRSVRFGLEEAHGRGLAMQFTYLLRHGGFAFDNEEQKVALSDTHTHTRTHTLSLSLFRSLCISPSLFLSLSQSLDLNRSYSCCLYLYLRRSLAIPLSFSVSVSGLYLPLRFSWGY